MKKAVFALFLVATFMSCLAARPAQAQMFADPFQNDVWSVRAVQTQAEAPQTQEVRVMPPQTLSAPTGGWSATDRTLSSADAAWSAPITNPTRYVPMGQVQMVSAPAPAPPQTTILVVPSYSTGLQRVISTGSDDAWSTPLSSPNPYQPMR